MRPLKELWGIAPRRLGIRLAFRYRRRGSVPSFRRPSPGISIVDLLAERESKIHFDIVCWVAKRSGPANRIAHPLTRSEPVRDAGHDGRPRGLNRAFATPAGTSL